MSKKKNKQIVKNILILAIILIIGITIGYFTKGINVNNTNTCETPQISCDNKDLTDNINKLLTENQCFENNFDLLFTQCVSQLEPAIDDVGDSSQGDGSYCKIRNEQNAITMANIVNDCMRFYANKTKYC